MSQFIHRRGTKLTVAAAITAVVVAGMIAEKGWLPLAPLAAQHYSLEMSSLFVGSLLVGMLFGWVLFSRLSIARSVHPTGDEVFDNPSDWRPDEPAHGVPAAKIPWDNLRRIEQMEAAQREAPPRGSAELSDQFQAAVGSLIGMGSPAVIDRKPLPRPFTKTVEITPFLAGIVANRSEASPRRSVETVPTSGNENAGPAGGSEVAREVATQAAGRAADALKAVPAIAERINPPALKAVIAAVCAGEAGKGFAAVARELAVFAARTAKVLEQLGVQIGEMQAATRDPCSASPSRQASAPPERAHQRSRSRDRTRDEADRSQRPTPRPRRRRLGLR